MGKYLIYVGLLIVAVGLIWMGAERLGLGKLPGDIHVKKENVEFYFPIVTSIVISIGLSLILALINYFRK